MTLSASEPSQVTNTLSLFLSLSLSLSLSCSRDDIYAFTSREKYRAMRICEFARAHVHAHTHTHTRAHTVRIVPRVFARALIKLQLKQPATRARRNFPPLYA